MTTGLEFKPCPAIIIRPELRYDVNDESRPFDNKHDLFTAATDVICAGKGIGRTECLAGPIAATTIF